MWNSIKKFFGPSKRDKERIERWRELTNSDDKLTIEHFDKAVNPEEEDEMEGLSDGVDIVDDDTENIVAPED